MLNQRAWQNLGSPFAVEPIPIPAHAIEWKRVLITGAGGSIGAALAHAIGGYQLEQILLLDASEQALYRIDRELRVPHTSILANICDQVAMEEVFERYCPQIIVHAAAFKHVPLMEKHPFAAIENNAIGTFLFAQMAIKHRAEQFLLVSTDKAADPASIMGASKSVAERTALALQSSATKIKAVRLSNVLGSQGSVLPLFEEQITQKQPVTVTHPEATRYFLTLEQTVALLLYALREDFPGTILVPELKTPVRIEEIAEALLEQTGSKSQIVYTGLRPGEKLHEQLLSNDETLLADADGLLSIVQREGLSVADAEDAMDRLREAVEERNLAKLLHTTTNIVPGYRPSEALLVLQAATVCRA